MHVVGSHQESRLVGQESCWPSKAWKWTLTFTCLPCVINIEVPWIVAGLEQIISAFKWEMAEEYSKSAFVQISSVQPRKMPTFGLFIPRSIYELFSPKSREISGKANFSDQFLNCLRYFLVPFISMAAPRSDQRLTRIAVVDPAKCRPSNCGLECKTFCPVERMGKMCVEVTRTSKTTSISEIMCNGCGICTKKCPMDAIRYPMSWTALISICRIINLPKELDKDTTHRYSENSFKLHRLPVPRMGKVLGMVGSNGTGKSTAVKILAGIVCSVGIN